MLTKATGNRMENCINVYALNKNLSKLEYKRIYLSENTKFWQQNMEMCNSTLILP